MTFSTLFEGWKNIYNYLDECDDNTMLNYYMGLKNDHPGICVMGRMVYRFNRLCDIALHLQ